jgi:thiamine biosynthesis lipoprotein
VKTDTRTFLVSLLIVASLLAAAALWRMLGPASPTSEGTVTVARVLKAVMGTDGEVKIVLQGDPKSRADSAFAAAERVLRDVEALMSRHIERSELSRLNGAPAGEKVPLSARTLEVLRASRDLHRETRGAFDVTVWPLVRLWEGAGKAGRLPSAAEVAAARGSSQWDQIRLLEDGAVKTTQTAGADLGGIAKGFGVDLAVEALKKEGISGGIVNLGGGLRCFGRPPGGDKWEVDVLDPFRADKKETFAALWIGEGAVCTSGNYHRYSLINGVRYSHIIDPSTGWPAKASPSATVVAPTCMIADGWATALCVLGPEGLALLPKDAGMEAMVVVGDPGSAVAYVTEGFPQLFKDPPGIPVKPWRSAMPVGLIHRGVESVADDAGHLFARHSHEVLRGRFADEEDPFHGTLGDDRLKRLHALRVVLLVIDLREVVQHRE